MGMAAIEKLEKIDISWKHAYRQKDTDILHRVTNVIANAGNVSTDIITILHQEIESEKQKMSDSDSFLNNFEKLNELTEYTNKL